ncbi:MAG: hypothetical protein AABX89_05785 [Candidatus Thermoplasmatota archaeon]
MRWSPLAVALLLSGCLAGVEPAPAHTASGTPFEEYASCPIVENETVPCQSDAIRTLRGVVEPTIRPGWQCIGYYNRAQDMPGSDGWPIEWGLFVGPAVADDNSQVLPGDLQLALSIRGNGTGPLSGVFQVVSDDRELLYEWEGTESHIVRFPGKLGSPEVYYQGLLANGTTWASDDPGITEVRPVWSAREAGPSPFGDPQGPEIRAIHSTNGATVAYLPATLRPNSNTTIVRYASHDPRQDAGYAHWGQVGGSWLPTFWSNVTSHGRSVTAGTSPAIFLNGEFENVRNPLFTSVVDFSCRCPNDFVADVEGAFCLVGVPPPIVRHDSSGRVLSLASHS